MFRYYSPDGEMETRIEKAKSGGTGVETKRAYKTLSKLPFSDIPLQFLPALVSSLVRNEAGPQRRRSVAAARGSASTEAEDGEKVRMRVRMTRPMVRASSTRRRRVEEQLRLARRRSSSNNLDRFFDAAHRSPPRSLFTPADDG